MSFVTYADQTNYNWTTYPHPLYKGGASKKNLTKTQLLTRTEQALESKRKEIEMLRDMSMRSMLTEEEMEAAFDTLYDAADIVRNYKKVMPLSEQDKIIQHENNWILPYMSDLILFGVGPYAEVREESDEEYSKMSEDKKKNTTRMLVSVRYLPKERIGVDVPLYNWLAIDPYFWDKNYTAEAEQYEETGVLPYEPEMVMSNY